MNLMLKGRGVDLNERLRGYATEKLTKSQRLFERIISMGVEFVKEAHPSAPHRVEVTVKTPQATHRAHAEAADWFSAVDQAVDRLETQLRKRKERLVGRSHPRNNHTDHPARGGGDDEYPDILVTRIEMKPMSPDEAVLELESTGQQFVYFMNAESMATAVLYRRGSNAYGLIEAED